jgi:hypothetical protein
MGGREGELAPADCPMSASGLYPAAHRLREGAQELRPRADNGGVGYPMGVAMGLSSHAQMRGSGSFGLDVGL